MRVIRLLLLVSFVVTFVWVSPGRAQTYPTQRIQLLVPFSAGTVLDTLARVVAERFTADFGQPVVVLNRPGAAGTIAFGEVASAAPDGNTLIFAGQSQLTVQPHLKADLPYRVEDFVPICQMFETPFALVTGPDSPFKDFQTFVDAAREKPGAIRFGHSGVGAVPHLFGTMLAQSAGFKMTDVPYRGLGDLIKDVLGGTIDTSVLSIGSFSNARVIAVFNGKRSKAYPDAPTVAELGHRVPLRSTNGLFAPSATPAPVIAQLREACARAFNSEKFRTMAARLDVNDEFVPGDKFARQLQDERVEMKAALGALGFTVR